MVPHSSTTYCKGSYTALWCKDDLLGHIQGYIAASSPSWIVAPPPQVGPHSYSTPILAASEVIKCLIHQMTLVCPLFRHVLHSLPLSEYPKNQTIALVLWNSIPLLGWSYLSSFRWLSCYDLLYPTMEVVRLISLLKSCQNIFINYYWW